jgi:hypothetical protein
MPFASEAQRRKFYAMAERGEISKGKVREYERETKGDLPEKVKKVKEETLDGAKRRAAHRAEQGKRQEHSKEAARLAKSKAKKAAAKRRG